AASAPGQGHRCAQLPGDRWRSVVAAAVGDDDLPELRLAVERNEELRKPFCLVECGDHDGDAAGGSDGRGLTIRCRLRAWVWRRTYRTLFQSKTPASRKWSVIGARVTSGPLGSSR